MVKEDDLSEMEVYVRATSLSLDDRFTILAATSPFLEAAPLRARRHSFNEGPLVGALSRNYWNENNTDVINLFGLRVPEVQDYSYEQRAGSMARSGSLASMPRSLRGSSWDNLSVHSISNLSQRSGQSNRSRRSREEFNDPSRMVSQPRYQHLDLRERLEMRNAWIRGRNERGRGRASKRQRQRQRKRGRGRGRGSGNGSESGLVRGRGRGRGNWRWQGGVQQGWISHRDRLQRGRGRWRGRGRGQRGRGITQNRFPMTPRSRACLDESTNETDSAGPSRGAFSGRGRGRGRGRGGITRNGMPQLKTLAELDKELDEYMASTPAMLNKELDEYMAQNGMEEDDDL